MFFQIKLDALGMLPTLKPEELEEVNLNTEISWKNPGYIYILLQTPGIDLFQQMGVAIDMDAIEIVQILLHDKKFDPSWRINLLLRKAVGDGKVEIVKLLLKDPRVDPSVNNNEPLATATKRGLTKIIELLKADPRVQAKMTKGGRRKTKPTKPTKRRLSMRRNHTRKWRRR